MSYVLSKAHEELLSQLLPEVDKGVIRVRAEIAPDHNGDERLYLRVVLRDDASMSKPSLKLGRRLTKIASALHVRAGSLQLPLPVSVDFDLESELPKRKTA